MPPLSGITPREVTEVEAAPHSVLASTFPLVISRFDPDSSFANGMRR